MQIEINHLTIELYNITHASQETELEINIFLNNIYFSEKRIKSFARSYSDSHLDGECT